MFRQSMGDFGGGGGDDPEAAGYGYTSKMLHLGPEKPRSHYRPSQFIITRYSMERTCRLGFFNGQHRTVRLSVNIQQPLFLAQVHI